MSIYSLLQASTYITMCIKVLLVLKIFGKLKDPFTTNLLGWWALCLPIPTRPNATFRRALRTMYFPKWSFPMPWFQSRSYELLDQETEASQALQIKVNFLFITRSKRFSERRPRCQKPCFYCRHGYQELSHTMTCCYYNVWSIHKPLCPPTSPKSCFHLHTSSGIPKKALSEKHKTKERNISYKGIAKLWLVISIFPHWTESVYNLLTI